MRFPELPKIDWEHVFKLFEKVILVYKLIEGVFTMFGFFKSIKAEYAALVAKFEALEAKVESYFSDKQDAPVAEVKVDTTPEATTTVATDAGNGPLSDESGSKTVSTDTSGSTFTGGVLVGSSAAKE